MILTVFILQCVLRDLRRIIGLVLFCVILLFYWHLLCSFLHWLNSKDWRWNI